MFPFDEQNCSLDLIESSFAFFDYSIVANNQSNYLLYSIESSEWRVTALNTAKHTESVHRLVKVAPDRYERAPAEGRSDDALRVNLRLNRTPSCYVFNVLAPLLTIAAISASLALFLPSAESKPYLVLCMFQSLIFAVSPKTSSIPLLGLYVISLLLLSTLYTCWCCVVYLLIHKPSSDCPPRALLASVDGARVLGHRVRLMVSTVACNSLLGPTLWRKLGFILLQLSRRNTKAPSYAQSAVAEESACAPPAVLFELHPTPRANDSTENWHSLAPRLNIVVSVLYLLLHACAFGAFVVPLIRAGILSALKEQYHECGSC